LRRLNMKKKSLDIDEDESSHDYLDLDGQPKRIVGDHASQRELIQNPK